MKLLFLSVLVFLSFSLCLCDPHFSNNDISAYEARRLNRQMRVVEEEIAFMERRLSSARLAKDEVEQTIRKYEDTIKRLKDSYETLLKEQYPVCGESIAFSLRGGVVLGDTKQ
jgi:hypothetical protein